MRNAKRIRFSLALLCTFGAAQADTGLYPDAAPPDASFLRFVGFDSKEPVVFAGKHFDLSASEGTPYVPVSAALLDGVSPGAYLTVVQGANGQVQTIHESTARDPARVHLFLVNTTNHDLDLRVTGSETKVIEGIAPMQSGTRAVNPVRIGLSVADTESANPVQSFQIDLRRGQNLSFLATPEGVKLIEHRFAPVAR